MGVFLCCVQRVDLRQIRRRQLSRMKWVYFIMMSVSCVSQGTESNYSFLSNVVQTFPLSKVCCVSLFNSKNGRFSISKLSKERYVCGSISKSCNWVSIEIFVQWSSFSVGVKKPEGIYQSLSKGLEYSSGHLMLPGYWRHKFGTAKTVPHAYDFCVCFFLPYHNQHIMRNVILITPRRWSLLCIRFRRVSFWMVSLVMSIPPFDVCDQPRKCSIGSLADGVNSASNDGQLFWWDSDGNSCWGGIKFIILTKVLRSMLHVLAKVQSFVLVILHLLIWFFESHVPCSKETQSEINSTGDQRRFWYLRDFQWRWWK